MVDRPKVERMQTRTIYCCETEEAELQIWAIPIVISIVPIKNNFNTGIRMGSWLISCPRIEKKMIYPPIFHISSKVDIMHESIMDGDCALFPADMICMGSVSGLLK